MQFNFNEVSEGINPGAGSQAAGPIGICADNSPASAASAGGGRDPKFPDPRACDHRHTRRQWDRVRKDFGFDNGSLRRSQWQLVPQCQLREVELLWDRISPKLVFSEHPRRASVHKSGSQYVIRGLEVGNTAIHAMSAKGICRSELQITIRAPVEIPVVFHHVRDVHHPDYKSNHNPRDLLRRVNEIFPPQTCISFKEQANPQPFFDKRPDNGRPLDFGGAVNPWDPEAEELFFRRVIALNTLKAINVFFVWWVKDNEGDTGGAEYGAGIYLASIARPGPGQKLAHEIGHFLTRKAPPELYDPFGHTSDERCLMEPTAKGAWISRDESGLMYDAAAKLAAP